MARVFALLVVFAAGSLANAQGPETNYDEAKVPKYALPDVLAMRNGERVRDAKTWETRRRPEILELYRTEVFGHSPARPAKLDYEVTSVDKQALGGRAIRKQLTVWFARQAGGPKMDILLYLPAAARQPVPVFLGLGFAGNQSVYLDPGIKLGNEWVRDSVTKAMVKQAATEKSRGSQQARWQLDRILEHGYGLATIYYGDIEPDFDGGMRYGIRPLFFRPGQTEPARDEWGAIGAWAWGLSRALDYLETDSAVDAKRVAVIGHSRLGKTALWAGAQDTRFSIVISNDSGEGGAAISRRDFGERTADLNTHFPHWFCANFRKYNGREDEMPVDSHMLLALMAPRPLYVASAQEDLWADPRGEFLGVVNASPVYELLGKQGIRTEQMPGVEQPIMHAVGYHVRAGKHDITAYDWEQYLRFADIEWGARKRDFPKRLRAGLWKAAGHQDVAGLEQFAIATAGIALWDILGKAAGLPAYQLLGACADRVPAYSPCGWYDEGGSDLAQLQRTVAAAFEEGFAAVKIAVGRAPLEDDIRRIEAAQAIAGKARRVMVDAHQAFDLNEALRRGRVY